MAEQEVPLEINLALSFSFLEEVIQQSAFIKRHFKEGEGQELLEGVLYRASEIAGDPNGEFQQQDPCATFEGDPQSVNKLAQMASVVASNAIAAGAFEEAAREVVFKTMSEAIRLFDQSSFAHASSVPVISDTERSFLSAFRTFKIADLLHDFSITNSEILDGDAPVSLPVEPTALAKKTAAQIDAELSRK